MAATDAAEQSTPVAGSLIERDTAAGFDLLRPWKVISRNNLYIVYLSVALFGFYAFTQHGLNWIALLTSLIVSVPIGFAIAFFETQAMDFRRRHRRTRFWIYLIYRTFRVTVWFLALFLIIMLLVIWLDINTYETIFPRSLYDFFATRKVIEFLGISLGISLASNFMDELHRKLGRDALFHLVLGKYHQVKQEDRFFLFIDLNRSTEIAEEMGELEFSHFLQDYYYDISEPIARYNGNVYQYVGDEVVVTWLLRKGARYSVALRCFFAIQKQVRRYEKQYLKRYGRVPEFKGALHGGNVVVSEVGKYKSEIAYHGDVLNTTARILGKCHELDSEYIVSDYVIEHLEIPRYVKIEPLGSFQLRGKQQEVELYSAFLSMRKIEDRRRRRMRLFRRRMQPSD